MEQYSKDYGSGIKEYFRNQAEQPAPVYEACPSVDLEAGDEADSNFHPQPQDQMDNIRGKCGSPNRELLAVKCVYFFFYSAFGSLFPLLGLYFKQMGMNPGQCGILIGMRPFLEFLTAPFWGFYADRSKQGKKLLLASLASWIIFILPFGFIQPEAVGCVQRYNMTYVITTLEVDPRLTKGEVSVDLDLESKLQVLDDANPTGLDRKRRSSSFIPASPLNVKYASNYDASQHKDFVSPLFSSIVYKAADIQKAFFLLLLLVIIGGVFSAPAMTLVDSAVITLLGEDSEKYGHQRMFGSLGWGLAMLFVGIALDQSTSFPDHPCGPEKQEKKYTICFAAFFALMTAAIISATQITFKYDFTESEEQSVDSADIKPSVEDEMQNQLAAQLHLPSLAVGGGTGMGAPQSMPQPGAQTKMFAQTTRQMPEWVTIFKHFKDLKCASFLFVAWFMGFGIGLIFTFLFWHLQDYGGSLILFGDASAINHASEIFAYFFSFRLITKIGHVKLLCFGLIGNLLLFLYISWLRNPWWVLPSEVVNGITHAVVWAACCSFIAHNTPQQLRASAQGVLQGIHHGLGRGCGAVIGGLFVTYFGTQVTFRGYGIACLLALAPFVFINFCRKKRGFVSEVPTKEDPQQVAEETSQLAPMGS